MGPCSSGSPVLLTAVLISYHIADDARRRLELVEFLARLGIHRFEITFERSIEHYIAGGGERRQTENCSLSDQTICRSWRPRR